jgi:hypothetical protein
MASLGITKKLHNGYFNARQDGKVSTIEGLNAFLRSRFQDPVAFDAARKSSAVKLMMAEYAGMESTLKTRGVPTFVVSGKYLIKLEGISGWGDIGSIADYLIEKQP